MLGYVALQGTKRAAATFGGKFLTAMAGYGLAKLANSIYDEWCKESEEKETPEEKQTRETIINALGAAIGAVAFSTADESFICK